MKYIQICLILTCTFGLKAQVNYSFPTSNASWIYAHYTGSNAPVTVTTSSMGYTDALFTIGGKVFSVLTVSSSNQLKTNYLRSENDKILMITSVLGNNFNEEVIYDFSLSVQGSFSGADFVKSVYTTTSQLVSNTNRKKWVLTSAEEYIEGIGAINRSLVGPFYWQPTCNCGSVELVCFKQNGSIVYSNPNYSDCIVSVTSINQNSSQLQIQIYPNPASQSIQVVSIQAIDIQVFDMLGNEKYTSKIKNEIHHIEGLPSGMYTLKAGSIIKKIVIK